MQEMPRSVSMTRTRELRSRMTGKLSRPVLKAGRKEQSFLPSDQIVSQHVDDKLDRRGQRQVNETIGLRVPKEVIEHKCAFYMRRGKPAQRAEMIRDSDYSIMSKYQSEYRGIVQYYLLAQNVGWFNQLHWVAQTSLLKT